MRFIGLFSSLVTIACLWYGHSTVLAGRFQVSSAEEEELIVSRIRASHFLARATFGPTMDEINALAARIRERGYRRALDEWIDQQFELPATRQVDTYIAMLRDNGFPDFERQKPEGVPGRLRADAWWHNSITAEDQLRQRMAWALAQIFVVNDFTGFNSTAIETGGLPRCAGYSHYYDIFVDHAFGNYRDVLWDVTVHPIMGFFLTHLHNRKANPENGTYPDENYARECMQLFTIGLYKVKDLTGEYARDANGELIPTYDNGDIDTMSRVFTGWTFNTPGFAGKSRYTAPMKNYAPQHDRDRKVLLDGTVLRERQSGVKDTQAALDMLFNQQETSPFVSRRLIQRFTHSNPSPNYIQNVARWFHGGRRGTRGDLRAVLKAILLSPEATGLRVKRIRDAKQNVIAVEVSGRRDAQTALREPVIRLTAFIRAFKGRSLGRSDRFHLGDLREVLNQSPFKSPSVFNFYSPDHQPPGPLTSTDLVAPEFEILTSVAVNEFHNLFREAARVRRISLPRFKSRIVDVVLDIDDLYEVSRDKTYAEFNGQGIDDVLAYLDLLLCQGTMSEETKQHIASATRLAVTRQGSRRSRRLAVQSMLTLVLTSPDCAIMD